MSESILAISSVRVAPSVRAELIVDGEQHRSNCPWCGLVVAGSPAPIDPAIIMFTCRRPRDPGLAALWDREHGANLLGQVGWSIQS